MSEANPILKLESVSHGYVQAGRRIDVLTDVNLELKAGRITALVGPSGAGKTTLLNLAGLLEQPGSGQIWVAGAKASSLSERKRTQLRRRRIGMVFQFHRLFPEFNATENIMIPQMLNGLAKTEAEKRAQLLLGMVGLSDRATHRPVACFPAGNSNVSLLPGLWRMPLIFCLLMSQQETLIRKRARWCFRHYRKLFMAHRQPPLSLHITRSWPR